MQSYHKIFLISLLLSTFFGAGANASYLLAFFTKASIYRTYASEALLLLSISSICIALFFIGKKVNLRLGLRKNIIWLAAGSWIGYLISYAPMYYFYQNGPGATLYGTGSQVLNWASFSAIILREVTSAVFSGFFFIALAVMTLAYVSRQQQINISSSFVPTEQAAPQKAGNRKFLFITAASALALTVVYCLMLNAIFLGFTVMNVPNPDVLNLWFSALGYIAELSFIISPILFFATFYFIGKKFSDTLNRKTIVTLAAVSLLSYAITYGVLLTYCSFAQSLNFGTADWSIRFLRISALNIGQTFFASITHAFSTVFFVALAALALAHLLKNKPSEPAAPLEALPPNAS